MSTEENKALGRRWIEEIWNKGNLGVLDELATADFVFHWAPPGVASNLEGYKQVVTMFRSAFQDMQVTVDDIVAEGDKVAVRWTGHSTHKGEFMGIPPTGKQVTTTGITISRTVGGKAVEEWNEMDMMGMMMQLGVVPPPA